MKSESDPFAGRYLFHVHTTLTDSQVNIEDYFKQGIRYNIEKIIFLEHIRRKPLYDIGTFLLEVERYKNYFGIQAMVGFEAKILPDGNLDISDEHLQLAEIIGIAEHGFPDDRELLGKSFISAIKTYQSVIEEKPTVWVHPGLWFQKKRLIPHLMPEYLSMMQYAITHGLYIERNLKYKLIDDSILEFCSRDKVVIGADAHRLEDIEIWAEFIGQNSFTARSDVPAAGE